MARSDFVRHFVGRAALRNLRKAEGVKRRGGEPVVTNFGLRLFSWLVHHLCPLSGCVCHGFDHGVRSRPLALTDSQSVCQFVISFVYLSFVEMVFNPEL